MKKLIFCCCTFFLCVGDLFAQPSSVYFASYPCLTPDAEQIVFSHEGDLWVVPTEGGLATRLTAMDGHESRPHISPDGKWLAFNSNMYGNDDVFMMPMNGGPIVRLTYHQGFDHVDSWSWDSRFIYFTSDRYNLHSGYKISIDGSTPERVFDEGYFNNSHHLVEHPQTGELFFNESWESKRFAHRVGYQGPYNPDIKSFNPQDEVYTVYTTWEGKDFMPTIDRQGNVYFVSDQANGHYNLYLLTDSLSVNLTDFEQPIKRPNVSADGKKVVFELNYQVHCYDVATQTVVTPEITFQSYDRLMASEISNVKDEITAFDVSPDGEKLIFVAGGEIFVSDISGKFVKQIATPKGGRVKEVLWLSDSRSFVYNQTVNGYLKIFKKDLDKEAEALTEALVDDRRMTLDHTREHLLYLSGTRQLKELNLQDGHNELLVETEFWGIYNAPPAYAPHDNRWVLYSAIRNFERDVFVYDKVLGKSINLTQTGVGEFFPVFSSSGKSIYFASDRFKPSFPRGTRNNHIYNLPLAKYSLPFKSDKLQELLETKKEKDAATESVVIDTVDLISRVSLFGPRYGNQQFPVAVASGEGDGVLYVSDHDEGRMAMWLTIQKPFENAHTQIVKGTYGARNFLLRTVENKHYVMFNGGIYSLNIGDASVKKIELDFGYPVSLRYRFEQMYEETWANVTENYYDEQSAINLDSIYKAFEVYLPYVTNRNDLRVLINDLLGALNTSHMGFSSKGDEEKTHHHNYTLSSGIVFEKLAPYIVQKVVHNSASDKLDLDIRKGDRLVTVNGVEVKTTDNREKYFSSIQENEPLILGFLREGVTFTVKVHPQSFEEFRKLLYDEWERDNESLVNKESKGRVAYLHMKDMGQSALETFIIKMTSAAYQKEGLILDLRYNQGGNVHDQVLQFLSQKTYMRWKYRGGQLSSQPNFIPGSKPIVVLINEQTLSDGEVTAEGFKQLDLGKVIGMPTYRWIIFTTEGRLVDGSRYRLPVWGCYTLDGEDLEKVGVNPDIFVPENFEQRYHNEQPQLRRAIEEVLQEMTK